MKHLQIAKELTPEERLQKEIIEVTLVLVPQTQLVKLPIK